MLVETLGISVPYILFRSSRALVNRRVRGSFRLYRMLCRIGVFRSFTYRAGGTAFSVPVSNPDNAWVAEDVETYEGPVLDLMCAALERLPDPVLIDCGADIGTFSALLVARLPRIREIVAIEPRPEVVPWLRRNMDALPAKTRVVVGAVSDFMGRGFMRHSPDDPSGHACFLAPDAAGNIEVITIDSLGLNSACVALKIDVEGAELQVLKGAYGLLTRAQDFVVLWRPIAKSPLEPVSIQSNFCDSLTRFGNANSESLKRGPALILAGPSSYRARSRTRTLSPGPHKTVAWRLQTAQTHSDVDGHDRTQPRWLGVLRYFGYACVGIELLAG